MTTGALDARESGSALVYDHGELMGWEYGGHKGIWDGTGTGIGRT